ncbi:hypothetical protein D6783_00960 [Candidatus Woesearchaeota archaeon]|nr:MAG: hypothetical protein D6783_00960 [Candidatus Woesearchaeota archaeon]
MVLVKLLGLLDVAAGFITILEGRYSLHVRLVTITALYLIVKGGAFWQSLTSWLDIFIGFLLLIFIFFNMPLLSLIAGIHLIIKGLASLI